ncbi:MAG: DUF882 domain-containing protein [Pseudomonadota bacterium]
MNYKLAIAFLILAMTLTSSAHGESGKNTYDYPTKKIKTTFPSGDGKITIYSYGLNETLDATYRKGDKYNFKELERIVTIFRSRSDNKTHKIDIELIEMLDHLQDHFNAEAIELISGYRSPNHNNNLRKNGVDAAEFSLHMDGIAADIHIDEVTEEMISEYTKNLKIGGVGLYPAHDFVHVDTGDVRYWDKPDKKGRLLIAFRKGTIWEAYTDRNIYLPDEEITYVIDNITRTSKKIERSPRLEIFRRGKWKVVEELNSPKSKSFKPGEAWTGAWKPDQNTAFGKYRITIPAPAGFEHLQVRSNEFYRKKK